jgi:hypothetical protein
MQKLYCYVDETGQDPPSEFFIVVAVVSDRDQSLFRKELVDIESIASTGQRKWHKSRPERRMKYLQTVMQKKVGLGEVYFGRYKKPLPYFLPILETIEKAITHKAKGEYRAEVFIDGIDKKKAAELTNALRLRQVRLDMIRSRRDESEPLIRLADMWAGCIRAAFLGKREAKELFELAKQSGYLIELTK